MEPEETGEGLLGEASVCVCLQEQEVYDQPHREGPIMTQAATVINPYSLPL